MTRAAGAPPRTKPARWRSQALALLDWPDDGLGEAQAGTRLRRAQLGTIELGNSIARGWLYERDQRYYVSGRGLDWARQRHRAT